MSKQLLILEPDERFALRLTKALEGVQAADVVVVPNTKDACLHLMQERRDLAFVPVSRGEKIIRAVRAVQSDLRIVVMAPAADFEIPTSFSGIVQGVLLKSHLDADLQSVLEGAFAQPFPLAEGDDKARWQNGDGPDIAMLIATLQKAKLGRLVQSAVFAQGKRLLAHWGELNSTQAATVAMHVGETWAETTQGVRLQFMHLPVRAGDMLLYTRQISENYLLSLVALPETPLSELRIQSDPLATGLLEVVSGKNRLAEQPAQETAREAADRRSYAIVWCPVAPIPASLHIPLRRAIARLAVANACVLTHNVVQSELVHLVMSCPPGRDSVWAAYLFKNGSEATIQQEFNVEANLWDTGYYAIESTDPLSDNELKIFLEHGGSK